jgi:transposase-like protein
MNVREIVGHLRDLYGVDVSPDLISTVTDAVLDEVAAWGKAAPSNRSTRWSSSTLCASKSGTKGWCAIRLCMSH